MGGAAVCRHHPRARLHALPALPHILVPAGGRLCALGLGVCLGAAHRVQLHVRVLCPLPPVASRRGHDIVGAAQVSRLCRLRAHVSVPALLQAEWGSPGRPRRGVHPLVHHRGDRDPGASRDNVPGRLRGGHATPRGLRLQDPPRVRPRPDRVARPPILADCPHRAQERQRRLRRHHRLVDGLHAHMAGLCLGVRAAFGAAEAGPQRQGPATADGRNSG
mmetsp:Transcript_39204/g.96502  ORF Transcript_39204/g.96502 Transcript_39204/m.96502 type:complete len:219 (+) Transcript_39204:454-1110(+)